MSLPASSARGTWWRRRLPDLDRGEVRLLTLACVAVFLVAIDSQALVLALDVIGKTFGAPLAGLADLGVYIQVGALLGLALGLLSDRLGRRRVLIFSVAGFSIVNVASAAAPSLTVLAILRVGAVCLETGAGATATALVIEGLRAGARAFGISLLTIASGAGAGVTTILWPFVSPNWRVLYLLGAFGLLGAAALHRWLRESEAWASAGAHRELALRLLLQGRWRRRLLVAVVTAVMGAVLYVPANLFYALRGDRLGMTQFQVSAVIVVGAIVSVPAFFVGAALSNRWGRRRLSIGLGVITAIFTALAFAGGMPTYWTGNLLWTIFASASSPVTGTWFGELFPTRARATSASVSAVAGASGGIVGLELVNVIGSARGLGAAIVLCAVIAVAGSIVLVWLPETLGTPLPE